MQKELAMIACLAIYFEMDSAHEWLPDLVASDTSPCYGFELSVARVGAEQVQEDGLLAEKLGFHVRPA